MSSAARLSFRSASAATHAAGLLGLFFLLSPLALRAQQGTPAQAPAPIIRIRPRPQTSVPATAPPDAAPLVNHPARPRPVNPQSLNGAATTVTQPATAASRPHTTPATTSATAATGQTVAPHVVHTPATTTVNPAGAAPSATGTEHTPAPKPAPLSNILNRNIVVLDPAHGAQDSGSRIGDNLLEKDVTLAFAFRLRSLLAARGLTVVLTRDSDAATQQATPSSAPTPLTLDDRAGIANHSRPAACLLLHATGRGTGIHLYTSELNPAPGEVSLLPWLDAQAAWVPASQQLERSVSSALGRSHITLVSSAASVRPVDSLTCPALVLELAPENSDPRSITDAGYQDRVASAIAGALIFWQNQVQTPTKVTATPTTHTPVHHRTATAAPKPSTTAPETQP